MRRPWRSLGLLWLAAMALVCTGLGHPPLRDWDEGIVARVALEISQHPWPQRLLPTYWGEAYLNKPPGLHWLIAATIQGWRSLTGAGNAALPPEWVVRLVPALGSSLLVPLLGLVQWQLRPGQRDRALATAVITLTLLPLARHGHLAMLDGSQLSAMALVWLGLLLGKPGRPGQTGLGGLLAGAGGSILLLLKAPVALPVLLSGLVLRHLDRQLPRASWGWLLLGCCVGLLPGLAWHGWHWHERGQEALVMWGAQGLARVASSVENHSGGPLPPLIQVVTGGWPWLPLWPIGIGLAWRERRQPWGLWSLGLTVVMSLLVLPLQTQLPWYSLLLWPPFALISAPVLVALARHRAPAAVQRWIPALWLALGGLLLAAGSVAVAAGGPQAFALTLPAGAGLCAAGWLLRPRSSRPGQRAICLLALGCYFSLALLFQSPLWNWELNASPSIQPLIGLVSPSSLGGGRSQLPLFVNSSEASRPSVRWYANQHLHRLRAKSLKPGEAALVVTQSERAPAGLRCQLDLAGSGGWNRWSCQKAGQAIIKKGEP
jgi:4-amino-4-deoxy-L-arabinose transferase-like glycosyltransferase